MQHMSWGVFDTYHPRYIEVKDLDMEDKDLASTKVLERAVLPFAVRHVDCHLQRFPI